MTQVMTGNLDWIGPLEPRSPLRAIDKLTWQAGGASTSTANEIRDPQRILRELGLANS